MLMYVGMLLPLTLYTPTTKTGSTHVLSLSLARILKSREKKQEMMSGAGVFVLGVRKLSYCRATFFGWKSPFKEPSSWTSGGSRLSTG